MAGPSLGQGQDAREAQYSRSLRSGLSASRGLPAFPGGATDDGSFDEEEEQSRMERARFAASQAQAVGAGVLGLAAAAAGRQTEFSSRPKISNEEKELWKGLYRIVDGAINSFFFATIWTMIMAIFLAPVVMAYYLIRLGRANLLNDGKPVKFPLFGITSGWLMPLEFPLGILNAMLWIFLSILSLLITITVVLIALRAYSELCGSLPFICKIPVGLVTK